MSERVANKTEALAAMRAGRADLEVALVAVGEARMDIPGVEGIWSVRDVLAHLTAYERWTGAMLQSVLTGAAPTNLDLYGREETPPEDDPGGHDGYNAWVVAHNRDRLLATVLAESRQAHALLLAAITDLSDDALTTPGHFPWIGDRSVLDILPNQSFNHYRMHLGALRGAALTPPPAGGTPLPAGEGEDAPQRRR